MCGCHIKSSDAKDRVGILLSKPGCHKPRVCLNADNWHSEKALLVECTCDVAGSKAKSNFLLLEEKLTTPILQDSFLDGWLWCCLHAQEKPDKRREIRPLLDFFNTIKRSLCLDLLCACGRISHVDGS